MWSLHAKARELESHGVDEHEQGRFRSVEPRDRQSWGLIEHLSSAVAVTLKAPESFGVGSWQIFGQRSAVRFAASSAFAPNDRLVLAARSAHEESLRRS